MADAGGGADLPVVLRHQQPALAVVQREIPEYPDQPEPGFRLRDLQRQPGENRHGSGAVLQDRPDAVVFGTHRSLVAGGEAAFAHEVSDVLQSAQRAAVRLGPEFFPDADQFGPGVVVIPLQVHVNQAVDQVDMGRVQPGSELPAAAAQRNRRLQLVTAAAQQRMIRLLKDRQRVAQLRFAVQEFGHRIDGDGFILVVKQAQ